MAGQQLYEKAAQEQSAGTSASGQTGSGDDDIIVVVAEAVEKPGNLGAILRTASAGGVDAVFVCDPRTDIFNPAVIRSSTGAIFSMPLVQLSNEECLSFMKENNIEPKKFIMFTDGYPFGSWGDPDYCDTVWIIRGNKDAQPPFGIWAHYEEEAAKKGK